MKDVNKLYIEEVLTYKNNFKSNHVFSLEQIDIFHDYFIEKYNLTWQDIEFLIKLYQCNDSIELFIM